MSKRIPGYMLACLLAATLMAPCALADDVQATQEPSASAEIELEATEAPQPEVEITAVPPVAATQKPEVATPAPTMHTVQFMAADTQTVLLELQLPSDEVLVDPQLEMQKEGHVFAHWYIIDPEAEAIVPYEFGCTVTENTVLLPWFTKVEDTAEEGATSAPEQDGSTESEELKSQNGEGQDDGSETAPDLENVEIEGAIAVVIVEDPEIEEPSEDDEPVEDLSNYTVEVFSSHDANIAEGEVVTLWATLTGFEGRNVQMQWQYYHDGAWQNAQGANGLTHSFGATKDTVNYDWRLLVEFVQ